MMKIDFFSVGAYITDIACLVSIGCRAKPHRHRLLLRALSVVCALSLGILYSSWAIPVFSGAVGRYVGRLLLNAAFFLFLCEESWEKSAYLGGFTALANTLIHGVFLTPLTDALETGAIAFTGNAYADFLLCCLIFLAIRGTLLFLVCKAIEPERFDRVHSISVILLVILTVSTLAIREMHFSMLKAGPETAGKELSVYFIFLHLALLAALLLYERYQYMLQDNNALHGQKIMTESLMKMLELRQEHDKAISQLRHDLKNHMLTLRGLLMRGELVQAMEYTESFLDASGQHELRVRTGRTILDALVSDKMGRAVEQGIAVSVIMDFRQGEFIEDFDLCMLMGNALDNAVEACMRIPREAGRFIDVKNTVSANSMIICITNSCAELPQRSGTVFITSKRNRQEHGYGLRIIRNVLKKYGGALQVCTDIPNKFTLIMSLPVPKPGDG